MTYATLMMTEKQAHLSQVKSGRVIKEEFFAALETYFVKHKIDQGYCDDEIGITNAVSLVEGVS